MPTEKKVVELDINDVLPNRFQPRIKFDDSSINELSESIKKYGVIQPIVVRKIGDKYEIIAGERRYKASVLAGKTTIPAIINELNDKESVEIALIENVQREDLTPIEKAVSYKKILDMGYMNQEDLAKKIGKSQSAVANTLRLLSLTEEVQEALLESKISERHARSLLKLKSEKDQVNMLNRIINERLTVRRTDEEIEIMTTEKPITIAEEPVIENQVVEPVEQPMFINPVVEPIIDQPVVEAPVIEQPTIIEPAFTMPEVTSVEPEMPINIQEIELPTYDFPSVEINNDIAPAPGFMDINKIEETAQDIIQPEKPTIDMDSLLKVEDNYKPTEDDTDDGDEALLKPGKFFNFFGDEETDLTQNNNFYNTQEPTFDPTPINSFEVPVMPEVQNNEVEIPSYQFEPVIEQPAPIEPTFTIPEVTSVEPEMSQEIVQNPEVPSVEINTFEPQNQFPDPLPIPESIEPAFINPVPQQEIPITSNQFIGDMKGVINLIRECGNNIEKSGFEIDLEEIDFEDSYQVIFKITKK